MDDGDEKKRVVKTEKTNATQNIELKDLETIEKRLEKTKRTAKTGNKEAQAEEGLLERIREALLQAKSARTVQPQNQDEEAMMESFQLITTKPVLYVCNVDEGSAATGNKYVEQVRELVKDENAEVMYLAVGTEADIAVFNVRKEEQLHTTVTH